MNNGKKNNNGPKFIDNIDIIDDELNKKRSKWKLDGIAWMDYDDVSQIIRIHIHNQWKKYDQSQPIRPWLQRVIYHQILNIVRNNYGNFVKPCVRCAACLPDNECEIYKTQCDSCPLYKNWGKKKKYAYETKFPSSIEFHQREINQTTDTFIEVQLISEITEDILKNLTDEDKIFFEEVYIKGISEEKVGRKLGWKTNEVSRKPGYQKMRETKQRIMEMAERIIESKTIL